MAALANYAKQDYEGARANLQTGLKKNPDFFDAARFLGQLEYVFAQKSLDAKDTAGAVAEYTKAAEMFKKSFDIQPNNADNIASLIDAYERSHQSDKAEAITRDAVTRDPNNKMFRYAFGVFLLKKEDYPGAIDQFTKTLEIDPGYSDASYNMGVAYLNWGVSIKAAGDKVVGVPIPADQNVTTKYPIAAISASKQSATAAAFVAYVLSSAGQQVLSAAGFASP